MPYDQDTGEITFQYRPPHWYDPELQRCKCNTKPAIIQQAAGASDFALFRYRCDVCGAEWCGYFEG